MSLVKYKKSWERKHSAFQVATHCTCVTFITAGAERTGGQYFGCTRPTIGTFDKCFVEYTSRGKSMASVLLAFYNEQLSKCLSDSPVLGTRLRYKITGPQWDEILFKSRKQYIFRRFGSPSNPASRSSILSRISASYSIHEFCFRRTILL